LIEYCRATASVAINFGRRGARPTIYFKSANNVRCWRLETKSFDSAISKKFLKLFPAFLERRDMNGQK